MNFGKMKRSKTLLITAVAALVAAGFAVAGPLVFHAVSPSKYDPGNTKLVASQWITGIGCPLNATYGCAGDPADKDNKGLLLAKTGPTSTNAAAQAQLKDIPSPTVNDLGYDLRKPGGDQNDPRGSHCGAGAPRFDIVTTTDDVYFIGCASGTATPVGVGWIRLRWDASATAFPQNGGATTTLGALSVKQIFILFDEGQDAAGAPDSFGLAVLDNVDLNGKLVGRG